MLQIIAVVLSLTFANVVLGDNGEFDQSQCVINYTGTPPDFQCSGYLNTHPRCNNSFLKIANSPYYDCSDIRMSWNYPMRNLTLIIESANYTKLRQPFKVSLKAGFGLPVYRILPNGKEVLIPYSTEGRAVATSDDNYQVVLKIEGPKRLQLYLADIKYNVEPIDNVL